jgi:hypothetical protein
MRKSNEKDSVVRPKRCQGGYTNNQEMEDWALALNSSLDLPQIEKTFDKTLQIFNHRLNWKEWKR